MSFNYSYNDEREKTIHERQGNVPQAEEKPTFPSAEELVKNIFTQRPPEPILDRAKAYRLQKMARFNALGRGIGVLGDVLSLGLGANVRRRQPDQISPAIYQSFESMMDKFENDKDAHRLALYQKELQNAQLGISHAYRREDQAWREKVQADELEMARAKNDLDWNKWANNYYQKERQNDATNAYRQGQLGYRQADLDYKYKKMEQDRELAIAKALADYWKDNTFMEIQVDGKVQKLTEGEYRGLLSEARQDMKWSGTDFETMMEPYINYPIEGLKNIVQRFSEFKSKRMEQQQMYTPWNLQRQQPRIDELTSGGLNGVFSQYQGPLRNPEPQATPATKQQNLPPVQDELIDADFDSTKYLRK